MQPYFFPYLGYFRLLQAADLFVVFDCVQFPRRGWVHRNRLPGPAGTLEWLTLPLARQPRDTLIRDLAFHPDAPALWSERLARFPWLAPQPVANGPGASRSVHTRLWPLLSDLDGDVVSYLERGTRFCASALRIEVDILRSSDLGIPRNFTGQERIVAIVKELGGTHYVNAPGGRELYSGQAFAAAGLTLSFLAPYTGDESSILKRLIGEPPDSLSEELIAATVLTT
jgi:hypothetical protein